MGLSFTYGERFWLLYMLSEAQAICKHQQELPEANVLRLRSVDNDIAEEKLLRR